MTSTKQLETYINQEICKYDFYIKLDEYSGIISSQVYDKKTGREIRIPFLYISKDFNKNNEEDVRDLENLKLELSEIREGFTSLERLNIQAYSVCLEMDCGFIRYFYVPIYEVSGKALGIFIDERLTYDNIFVCIAVRTRSLSDAEIGSIGMIIHEEHLKSIDDLPITMEELKIKARNILAELSKF